MRGLSKDKRSIANALVIFELGESQKTFTMLENNAKWTIDEYREAVELAYHLRVHLGSQAVANGAEQPESDRGSLLQELDQPIENPMASGVEKLTPESELEPEPDIEPDIEFPVKTDESVPDNPEIRQQIQRRRIASRLDNAFGMDEGMAEAWLSGRNPENARRFRTMLRQQLGIDRTTATGLLMVPRREGGAELTIQQAVMIGIVGLNFKLRNTADGLHRYDTDNTAAFDQVAEQLKEKNPEFRREYFAALTMLARFAERNIKTKK